MFRFYIQYINTTQNKDTTSSTDTFCTEKCTPTVKTHPVYCKQAAPMSYTYN